MQPITNKKLRPELGVERLRRQIGRVLGEFDRYEGELPLILVCTDTQTGECTHAGPIATRAEAERIVAHERATAGAGSALQFSIVPLYPAFDPVAAVATVTPSLSAGA